MTTALDGPADTAMMRIVHQALRRDLTRARAALAGEPPPEPERRRAIAAHLSWMMRFLHDHHRSEDEGLYPMVRSRAGDRPEVLGVLDRMAQQHELVASSIASVEVVAASLDVDGSDE